MSTDNKLRDEWNVVIAAKYSNRRASNFGYTINVDTGYTDRAPLYGASYS